MIRFNLKRYAIRHSLFVFETMSHRSIFDPESSSHNAFELPGAKPQYVPDRPGQVEHIFLDLVLDIPNQRCDGNCMIRITPVRDGITQMILNAVGLQIYGVTVGSLKQSYEYDGDRLTIQLPTPTQTGNTLVLGIDYSLVKPQRGLYFVGPDADYPDKSVQVWTQGEDEDSRFWFPCFDYPGQLATSEVRVKVPESFVAISNGELLETTRDGHQVSYHWHQRQVHPTYLMTLAVGKFVALSDTCQLCSEPSSEPLTIPILYYVEAGREEDAYRSMGKTPRMVEFFSQYYGYLYPYPKYAQVCVDDFIFGGMENTSTTLLTDRCLIDERAAIDNRTTETLVAHELAHQWFGDLVVIKHWSHAWLKEGMASYSEVMWTHHEYGADEAAYYRLREARNYLTEDKTRYRRPIVTHVYREAIELYDRHLYEKGACIYHMIRTELGEDLFWKSIHTFVQDNAHQTVETVDLLRAIEKTTGRNLLFLFDQYVYRGGHPDYSVSYSWDGDRKFAKVTVKQTQINPKSNRLHQDCFDLTLPIGFGFVSEENAPSLQTFSFHCHEPEQSLYIPLETKPDFISFDVGNHTLKTVELNYGLPELMAQLKHDPDPISRIYAAEAIAKKGGLKALKALEEALHSDSFWGVRAEVASQISAIKLDQALSGLKRGLQDQEARVRLAVVTAIATLKLPGSYQLLKPIVKHGDPSYYVEAAAIKGIGQLAACEALAKPKESKALNLIQQVLKERAGWNEVVRGGAIAALAHLKQSEAALALLLSYTQKGTPQPLRLSAIRSLGAVAGGQTPANLDRLLDCLETLAAESFFLTQVAVVTALNQTALSQLQSPRALKILRSLSTQTPDGRVRRQADEAIKGVQKAMESNQMTQAMQDDLEELKRTNQELNSRLAALEFQRFEVNQE